MDGVFEEGVAREAAFPPKGAGRAVVDLLIRKIRRHARFLRTIGYATGLTLCTLGVIARMAAEDARNAARSDKDPAAAERQAESAPQVSQLPLPPQPAALIDHTSRPDFSAARLGAQPDPYLPPSAPGSRAATPHRDAPRVAASGSPHGVLLRRDHPGYGQRPLAGRGVALNGAPQIRAQQRSGPAPGPQVSASTCPTCDCSALYNKRFFTLEPLRPEEQAWYSARCAR